MLTPALDLSTDSKHLRQHRADDEQLLKKSASFLFFLKGAQEDLITTLWEAVKVETKID